MKRLAMVVEGLGDRKAFPSLVTKTAQLFEQQVYVSHLVEGGGWEKLKIAGELERNCLLAASDGDPDEILVVVDLEDDCAKGEFEGVQERLKSISAAVHIPVNLCFAVREYETWFLEGLGGIVAKSPDIVWRVTELTPQQCMVRGAKEMFEATMGQSYRQSIDQEKFTKRLDLASLLSTSRAYRKFAKAVCCVDYDRFPT